MPPKNTDDLQVDKNLKRIDELESFRKEFEGKSFDGKVLQSINDSHHIRTELEKIIWQTVRNKITWIILGLIALIFTELLLRAIPSLFSRIF